jgi:hypothetical protein
MGLLIAFSTLFLILLAVLAFASVKLFAAKDEKGQRTAPGCLGGCMTALALTVIGLLGLVAFIAGAAAISASKSAKTVIEAADDFSVGVWHDRAASVKSVPDHPFHVVFEWTGHSEPTEAFLKELEKAGAKGEMQVAVDYQTNENGEPVTIVDVALRMKERDAAEIEKAIEAFLPDVELSEGVRIVLRKVESGEVR